MAKLLGILRHAKSDWSDGASRDFDRGLNDRGRRGAEVMGDHIRDDAQVWDMVIASPATRVKATFEVGLPEMELTFDERLYLASPDTIFEVVQEHGTSGDGEPDAILISGHNPGLYETILELVAPSQENELFKDFVIKFPTAAFAILECNIDSWADLKKFTGKLVHFKRPRDLDSELAPGA